MSRNFRLAACIIFIASHFGQSSTDSFPARLPNSTPKPIFDIFSGSDDESSTDGSDGEYQHSPTNETTDEPAPSKEAIATPKSLQTVQKLQQMLDETDYMITRRSTTTIANTPDELWTSRDRSKYKKQQRQMRILNAQRASASEEYTAPGLSRPCHSGNDQHFPPPPLPKPVRPSENEEKAKPPAGADERQPTEHTSPPLFVYSSDDDASEDQDDSLGYTLPNLPVYFSDAEGESDGDHEAHNQQPGKPMSSSSKAPPQPVSEGGESTATLQSGYAHGVPPHVGTATATYQECYPGHPQQGQMPPPPQGYQYPYPPPPMYPPGYAPPGSFPYPYLPTYHSSQPYAPYPHPYWTHAGPMPPRAPQSNGTPVRQTGVKKGVYSLSPPKQNETTSQNIHKPVNVASRATANRINSVDDQQQQTLYQSLSPVFADRTPATIPSAVAVSKQVGARKHRRPGSLINFASFANLSLLLATLVLGCYSAVPTTLPQTEYKVAFLQNLRTLSLVFVGPALNVFVVNDSRENDVNSLIRTFSTSFAFGYCVAFVCEIFFTTLLRLGLFLWFEPDVFSLSPRVPIPILPWVLRENKYRPKRITLFAADFGASCVASPIIEELVKLKILEWTTNLPRNFNWVPVLVGSAGNRPSSRRKMRGRRKAEPVVRLPGELEVVNANTYVMHMLVTSIGFKLCDAGRRILMYTKPQHLNKSFYAFCRGIFPIQELCGMMTAIGLAKRDLLGVSMPLWKLLLPAVVVHSMANFRGMKPIFKWNSAMPWTEMQLSPLRMNDSSTIPQLIKRNYPKLMWLVILARVFGYCVKNYFMINRQAVRRVTTYAGKHAAFSAELATTELLKRKKS